MNLLQMLKGIYPVFVYGTLKRGFHNNDLLRGALFVGVAETIAFRFRMGDTGGFPVVTESHAGEPNTGAVTGELYLVNDETLARLDQLEGARSDGGGMYRRKRVKIMLDGQVFKAFIYIGNGAFWKRNKLPLVEPTDGFFLTWKHKYDNAVDEDDEDDLDECTCDDFRNSGCPIHGDEPVETETTE